MAGQVANASPRQNRRKGAYLAATQYPEPQYLKALTGDCHGLVELRVVFANVQYRPLAFYGPGEREITFLVGAIEKGRRFDPPNACQTAKQRRQLVMSDPTNHTTDYEF
jgi:hypothetical protein